MSRLSTVEPQGIHLHDGMSIQINVEVGIIYG